MPEPTSTNLTIGLLLPPEEAEANNIRNGVTLAVDEANAHGPVAVRLVVRGRMGQWGADAIEAARMVTDDGAAGLIAPPNGAATHVVLQVAGRTSVPVVSLCPDSSVTQTGVPWMVRVVPSTIQEASALSKSLQSKSVGTAKRLTTLIPEGRTGREVAHDLEKATQAAGFEVTKIVVINRAKESLSSVLNDVLASKPDAILVWLDPSPAGIIVKALREAGFQGMLAGPGRLRCAEFRASAGQAITGFITTDLLLDQASDAKLRSFQLSYKRRFDCRPSAASVFSYDAASLLIKILETHAAQPSRAFPITFPWVGASGQFSFDVEGNRSAEFQLLKMGNTEEDKKI